jgi:hypothetical protein
MVLDASKTTLISIATILSASGAAILERNFWGGVILIAMAVGTLVVREILKSN